MGTQRPQKSQRDNSRFRLGLPKQVTFSLFDFAVRAVNDLKKAAPLFCQTHGSPYALKQGYPKLAFKPGDSSANSRLAGAKLLSGAADILMSTDNPKVFQKVPVTLLHVRSTNKEKRLILCVLDICWVNGN